MDQRHRALDRANEVRTARSRFKKQMKATVPADAFTVAIAQTVEPDQDFRSMKTADFLKTIPFVGKFHANKLVTMAQAKGTLGSLTPRQRTALAQHLTVMRQRRYGTTTTKEAIE